MAEDINSVTIVGRMTKDAELKYTNGGSAVTKFSIAVNRSRKDGDQWVEEASFFDVSLWGRRGESLNQYLQRGKRLAVTGELRQDRWEQDGQQRSRVFIHANNIQLLDSNKQGDSSGGNNQSGASYKKPGQESNGNNFEDDIPFARYDII
jgi:single-strand DNA-binding protein